MKKIIYLLTISWLWGGTLLAITKPTPRQPIAPADATHLHGTWQTKCLKEITQNGTSQINQISVEKSATNALIYTVSEMHYASKTCQPNTLFLNRINTYQPHVGSQVKVSNMGVKIQEGLEIELENLTQDVHYYPLKDKVANLDIDYFFPPCALIKKVSAKHMKVDLRSCSFNALYQTFAHVLGHPKRNDPFKALNPNNRDYIIRGQSDKVLGYARKELDKHLKRVKPDSPHNLFGTFINKTYVRESDVYFKLN